MKFLLAAINAKYIHSNPAVYSLRAYAKERLPEADIMIGFLVCSVFVFLFVFYLLF